MRKLLLMGGAVALVLTACTAGPQRIYTEGSGRTEGYRLSVASVPNPTAPNIFIIGDKIVIDQEPIRPPGNQAGDAIVIYFALEEGGMYSFPEHGIEIKGHLDFCKPAQGSVYIFKCTYNRPAPDTIFKYVVRVKKAGGGRITDLDPTIMN